MICEKCHKNEASIHYTEVINGTKSEHHLCGECAKDLDLSYYSNVLDSEFPLAKLLTGLLASSGMLEKESANPMAHVICPKCGMNYEEFTKVGKFGCGECYSVFAPLIEEHIKKLHNNVSHAGKQYKVNESREIVKDPVYDKNKEIEVLQAKIKEAVSAEDYEEAAKLRDHIKEIRGRNETNA